MRIWCSWLWIGGALSRGTLICVQRLSGAGQHSSSSRPGPGLVDVKEASLRVEAVDPQETELEIPCEKPMARGYPGAPVVDYLGQAGGRGQGLQRERHVAHMGDVPIFPPQVHFCVAAAGDC